jgi:hypothetical protein
MRTLFLQLENVQLFTEKPNAMAPLKGIQMNLNNYTIPMLIFTSLGILAMVFGLLLKREDKKKGFGLELPNIKSGLGIIALILLGSVIPGNAGAQTAPTEISVRDQNSIAGKNSPMAEKRIRSWAHHQELKNSSQFKDLTWRAVGPEYIGGRIQSIACHPKNPFTIYTGVGSAISGKRKITESPGLRFSSTNPRLPSDVSPSPHRIRKLSGWAPARYSWPGVHTPEPGFSNPPIAVRPGTK